MGNNADGQLGVGSPEDEEKIWEPLAVPSLEGTCVIKACMSLKHSIWITQDGVVHSAGDNDDGQLGRVGKRIRPLKIDSIEHLPIEDAACGAGFTIMAARLDGRLLGVGRGERGQLGMGGADRDNKEKVKFSSALGDEQLLAVSAGEAHCAGLCRSGRVLTFGENRHGQLGLGDFVSTATPKPVAALQCRPVVSLCCGGSHTLARTATGLLWAWGCNEHGQLGLGDLRARFRPEQVKALRVSRCADIAAGNRHTLMLSERGLVFACGAGGSGQLGSGGIAEAEPYPRVVEALKEIGRSLLVACGHSHSLALVWNEDAEKESVYCWGLGSSGQLGLPRDSLQDRKMAPLPQRLRQLPPGARVVDIASGPLAHHTFLLLADSSTEPSAASESNGKPMPAPRHSLRTAIDADALLQMLRSLVGSNSDGQAGGARMKALTQAVGAAFSSVSVMNASFRDTTSKSLGLTEKSSGVDLLKVRRAYNTVVFELNSPELVATLGRATLSMCDELAKQRVPTDDPETLCVFLVLFENPLLLGEHRTALFPGFHLALQRLTAAVLSLPKDSQRLLFGWLKHLPSEYFARVVDVMQQYVTFTLTQVGQNRTDASAAVLMLQTLWEANREMKGILPERCFHNEAISQSDELQEHYTQWRQQQSLVFSYCKYPFLLNAEAKRRLLSFDSKLQMESAMQELVALTYRQGLPVEATFEQMVGFRVRREHLLSDFCGQLWWRLQNQRACLGLPLSVEFVGELGIDAGGLRKECLQLVLRQIYENTRIFYELEELPGLVWFRPGDSSDLLGDMSTLAEELSRLELYDSSWTSHLPEIVGAIVGLAGFNGIYLDLRLHPLIYRFLRDRSVSAGLEDLRAMHPMLHHSLTSLRSADISNLGLSWGTRLPGGDVSFNLSGGKKDVEAPLDVADVEDFINYYAEAALVGAMRQTIEGFVKMATDCMPVGAAFTLCTADDLELLLCGLADIGKFKELEATCTYINGYAADSEPVKFFWEVVHSMSEIMKRKLLLFCTGCDRVPIAGLKALGFTISRVSVELDHLPTANTCVNQLNLPGYTSHEMMRDRLCRALEHHIGFGFV
jgi:alpha-tubulin suppressor-like RCC1 family protein